MAKKAVKFGAVFKPKEFYNNLENIFKRYNLNKGLINNKITVVTDPLYNPSNLEIIKNALEKLSFSKVDFINITKCYKLKKNKIFIIFHNSYLYFTKLNYKHKIESIFIDYKLFNSDFNKLAKYLSSITKNKQIFVFGYNKDIELLASKLENISNTKVYYYANPNDFIFNKIKNTLNK